MGVDCVAAFKTATTAEPCLQESHTPCGSSGGKLNLKKILPFILCGTPVAPQYSDHQVVHPAELLRLNTELYKVRAALAATRFTKEALEGNDTKVLFYSGLPTYHVLCLVYALVEKHVSHSSQHVLSKFEEMILFLMRLRLGLNLQDLAYRFNVPRQP
ncbi:unnamed protein product [Ixodes hexagonus]